jgi:hypothetical protein
MFKIISSEVLGVPPPQDSLVTPMSTAEYFLMVSGLANLYISEQKEIFW